MDEQARFEAETNEEAHYWFVLSDFVELLSKHGTDKVMIDALLLKKRRDRKQS